jgi:uncharacterized protein YecA (UPF0149 family)
MTTEKTVISEEVQMTPKESPVHVHGPNCNHGHSHEALKPISRSMPKVGRNDPCICGSQKKYKKCCGN